MEAASKIFNLPQPNSLILSRSQTIVSFKKDFVEAGRQKIKMQPGNNLNYQGNFE